jgi:hypothetical protein
MMATKWIKTSVWILGALWSLSGLPTRAQAQSWGDGMYHNGMQYMMWGSQLPTVTASGTAILDSVSMMGMLDSTGSHHLSFIDS